MNIWQAASSDMAMKLTIQVSRESRDAASVRTLEFSQDVVKLGRLPTSTIVLDDEAVARMHAVIEVQDGEARLIDLGSPTGTAVNGVRIKANATLKSGDSVDIGPFRLVVSIPKTDGDAKETKNADVAQGIARQIREATKVTPSPETLRQLEKNIARSLTPTVTAQLNANDGRVIVRIGRPKHDERGHVFVMHPGVVTILHEEE